MEWIVAQAGAVPRQRAHQPRPHFTRRERARVRELAARYPVERLAKRLGTTQTEIWRVLGEHHG